MTTLAVVGQFADGVRFIFERSTSQYGDTQVGGIGENGRLLLTHLQVCAYSLACAAAIAIPAGLWIGHLRRWQFIATSVSNVGRAVPSLALIAFFFSFLGPSLLNVVVALTLLAIPPLFTNTYIGVSQVDADTVDAARGMGLGEGRILTRVELPLALPLMFGGLRTAAVGVVATATIAPLMGVRTLGTPLIAQGVYGPAGQIGAAILVALLAVVVELLFGALQRVVTPRGLKLVGADAHARFAFLGSVKRARTA